MPSGLPTDNALDKAVKDFGIGTYDGQSDNSGTHGEDSEKKEPAGRSLPDDATRSPQTNDPFEHDRYLSYPDEPDARLGAADLPGDIDGNFQHSHPVIENVEPAVMSVAETKKKEAETADSHLPCDEDNPAARADYFEYSHPGHAGSTIVPSYIAPSSDTGAYVSQEQISESQLPGVVKNEVTMDNWLQSLGNWWSGQEIEDVSGPQGFPTTDFDENVDFDKSDQQDGGIQLPFGDSRTLSVDQKLWNQKMDEAMSLDGDEEKKQAIHGLYQELEEDAKKKKQQKRSSVQHVATNITLVNSLTRDFLKEFGKKDLTRRHVMAFLQKFGQPQFLSSDIIRCLKLSHEIFVKDVLDEFPVATLKQASSKPFLAHQTSIARAREHLINLEISNILNPEVSSILRRCAADLTLTLINLEKLESGK